MLIESRTQVCLGASLTRFSFYHLNFMVCKYLLNLLIIDIKYLLIPAVRLSTWLSLFVCKLKCVCVKVRVISVVVVKILANNILRFVT